jgi:hypothetical protein
MGHSLYDAGADSAIALVLAQGWWRIAVERGARCPCVVFIHEFEFVLSKTEVIYNLSREEEVTGGRLCGARFLENTGRAQGTAVFACEQPDSLFGTA